MAGLARTLKLFWVFLDLIIAPFKVGRGFKMILSHMAPSSLNMSSYRARTHFKPNFIFFEPNIPDPGLKILILVPKNVRSWSKILILVQKYHILGPSNCFYWGAAAPQNPCCSWGASSPPDPLAGGACSPPCPAYREAPPLGLAVFFGTKILVPRSWYQDLGTKK